MNIIEQLPKNLRELREQFGYTQKQVAALLGVVYQTYQSYELGANVPSLENFIMLADIYDVSLDALIGRKDF